MAINGGARLPVQHDDVPATQAALGKLGVPRRIAPISLIVPSGSIVRSVHCQAAA